MTLASHVVVENGAIVGQSGTAGDVPWWSFTKTVMAAAALALVREGRLALDIPLGPNPWTLRLLLQHRAGLTDYGRLIDYHAAVARDEEPWPTDEMMKRSEVGRLVYPIGEGWGYSNIGYFFVRRLIEETTGKTLGAALERLVIQPLGVTGVRFASTRGDLADVVLGEARNYDPRWVYHGLLVGPLSAACLLLERLLAGDLLPPSLRAEMLKPHLIGGPVEGRPWIAPGYGLGLMVGTVTDGTTIAGHTGGGPGSVVAVYRQLSASPTRTAAAFAFGGDQGEVERRCLP